MTDLTPNDLSHLSDDEFNALCPHDGHAPGPEPLSPAAKAVLDAAEPCVAPDECPGLEAAIAAALRAVAHEVAPFRRYPMNEYMDGFRDAKQSIHHQLTAIATELENHD